MANAASASKYELMTLNKNGKGVRLEGKTVTFNYYESLLSPCITANLIFVDTGASIIGNKKYDNQERLTNIYNGLPITGNEKLFVKIQSKLGSLDFQKNPLYVNDSASPGEESNRKIVVLGLVSNAAILDKESTLFQNYGGRISDTVKRIVSTELKINSDKFFATPTKNSYNFVGNSKSPFETLCLLASKSVPEQGNPGYFFYETSRGFNYKAIDDLIKQEPKATYFRTDVLRSGVETDENDFKISSFNIIKNQNVMSALESGVYVSRNVFFDPRYFKYKEIICKLPEKELPLEASLGKKEVEIPTNKSFTRTHYHILDVGTLDPTVAGNTNNSPLYWQAKSTMRYNLLFTQVINMTVPCNPQLCAGDIIKCNFETVSQDKKEMGSNDSTQSGNYLILNLCHHFDATRSFTSMTLVRDTYGLYTKKRG